MNIPQHYSPAHQSQNKKRPITTTKHQPREISAEYGQIYNLDNQCTYERKNKKKNSLNQPLTAIIDYSSNIANGAHTLTAYKASSRHEFALESRGRSFA